MHLLDISTTIIGFICCINGWYLSREIAAIASKNGLHPWLPAARKRREHFGVIWTLVCFPSEILRIIHDSSLSDKKNEDQNEKENDQDEALLKNACMLFSSCGFIMMVSSFFLQVYSQAHPLLSVAISAATWFTYVLISEPAYLFFPWHCLLGETLFVLTIGQLAPLVIIVVENSENVIKNNYTYNTAFTELLLRFLLVRLMWGFAKTKFATSNWNDRFYLLPFLRSMPVPSPFGLRAAAFLEKYLDAENIFEGATATTTNVDDPTSASSTKTVTKNETFIAKILKNILLVSYVFFAFAEIISPCFILFASRENWFWSKLLLGNGCVALLMTGIQTSGNFGFFPLLTATLSIVTFGESDHATFGLFHDVYGNFFEMIFGSSSSSFSTPQFLLLLLYVIHTTFAFLTFPLISWISFSWSYTLLGFCIEKTMLINNNHHKNIIAKNIFVKFLQNFIQYFMSPIATFFTTWRLVHPYGIFPPHTFPAARLGQVYEWSLDRGKTWNTYRYKYQMFHDDNENKVKMTSSKSSSKLLGNFVPFVHPHLDWASFYPMGFSGGSSLNHAIFFVSICPFRNYNLRLPVRVAHCLIQRKTTRVVDFFEKDSLPPQHNNNNSNENDDENFMVRSRGVFHLAPWSVSKKFLAKHKVLDNEGDESVSERVTELNDDGSEKKSKFSKSCFIPLFLSSSTPSKEPFWYQITGPQYETAISKKEYEQNIPEFAKSSVREIEWLHHEYAFTWRRWLLQHNTAVFAKRAEVANLQKFEANNNKNATCVLDFIKKLRQDQLSAKDKSRSEVLVHQCRSLVSHTFMLREQQRNMSSTRTGDWIGKIVIEVAYDLYKFGLRVHGSEGFSQVVSRILALTHFVDCFAEEEEDYTEKTFSTSSDREKEEEEKYSRIFLTSKVFMRHLACLAFVVCFLSAPIESEQTTNIQDNDEDETIQQLLCAILPSDTATNSNNTEFAEQIKTFSLRAFLGKLLFEMSKNSSGPCSDLPHSNPKRIAENNVNKETFSTILSVLVFVSFHAPSIRQEASLMRCLDAMALIGVDPESENPMMGKAAAPGYFWFFSRWIFAFMPWDETDLVADVENNINNKNNKHNNRVSKLIENEKNYERAPYYSYRVTTRLGLQHVLVDLHEILD